MPAAGVFYDTLIILVRDFPYHGLIGPIMKSPHIVIAALYGAGVGALTAVTIGFTAGGWVTDSTARYLAEAASLAAVTSVMTPYCLERSRSDAMSATVLTELESAHGLDRRDVIERAGWATPLGTEKPISDVAIACEIAIAKN